MSKPTIIADSAIPFLRGVLEPWAEVHYLPGAEISAANLTGADGLVIRTRTRCDEQLLSGSKVGIIATATIGFDHIDTAYCAAQGIRVATAAGCNARGVLQWLAATLVHLSRTQGWHPAERTLGVVGVGHVGSLVAHYAATWGFRVVCCDPPREVQQRQEGRAPFGFHPLEEVARTADLLTLHTPLDTTTRHMVNTQLLAQLKPQAIVINSSRGEVVDERALMESGHPCVLDVWGHEPLLDPTLLAHTLLATPHIAGYSEQGKATATALAVAAIATHFDLPLAGWYPTQAAPSAPCDVTWQELCTSIDGAFDIAAESAHLKAHPTEFESIRDGYHYRREYF